MPEVLRMRMVRAPQRTQASAGELVPSHVAGNSELIDQLRDARDATHRRAIAVYWANDPGLPDPGADFQTPLRRLDGRLVAAANRLEPAEILRGEDWDAGLLAADHNRLGDALLLSLLAEVPPETANRYHRLLLVVALVELALADPDALPDAQAVYDALRWRVVVLPPFLIPRPIDRLARRPGFSDLYVVRQDWARFEPAEVAYVENVLRGELRDRTHTRSVESESILVIEEESTQREERDTQVSERFDLSSEASSQTELAVHVEASIDVQGPAGPTTIQAHVGGSLDYSQTTADQHAMKTSREAVSRAAKIIETRTLTTRTARTLTTTTEVNKHTLDNTDDPQGHVTGVYRWVNKVLALQTFRYRHRFLAELQVPEPGAWWRWLLRGQRDEQAAGAPPLFTRADGQPLRVDDMTPEGYAAIAARYRAVGASGH